MNVLVSRVAVLEGWKYLLLITIVKNWRMQIKDKNTVYPSSVAKELKNKENISKICEISRGEKRKENK